MFNVFDSLSDFINRINISQNLKLKYFFYIYSNLLFSISRILFFEGYINNLFLLFFENKIFIILILKYYNGYSVIKFFKKVDKNNKKFFKKYKFIPNFNCGLGIIILSTNIGLITNNLSKKIGIGGRIICYVF